MSASSRSPDRFATTFDHEGLVANAGLILAGTLMDRLGLFGADRAVGAHRFREPGPQDLHRGRRDARRGHSYRSCRDAARRAHRAGAGVPPDGAVDGGVVPADVHVRSRPPARSGAVAHAGARLGAGRGPRRRAAGGRCGLHDLRGPRQTKTRRRVRLHQRARLSPAARCTRRHRRGSRRPHAQRVRGVVARRGALRRRARREPAARRGCGADHGARRLGVLVMEADRPSRRPRLQVVDHRRPHTRCSRSDPSDPRHRMDRHRLHQRRPRPSRRNPIRHRPRQTETHRPPRRAPHPPHRHRTTTTVARLEPLWLCWRLIGLVFQPRLGWSCGQRRTLLRILLAGCRCSGRGAVAG